MSTSRSAVLPAKIQLLIEDSIQEKKKRAIRRPVLIDRSSGLICELPTVHVYRDLKGKSLNTQLAALQDLAFYTAWTKLKQSQNRNWLPPEVRITHGKIALTTREIDDLCNWCQNCASDLAYALARETSTVRSIPLGIAVDSTTANRRIFTISNYLNWVIQELVEGTIHLEDRAVARSAMYQSRLRKDFTKNLNSIRKPSPVKSLSQEESKTLQSALQATLYFANSAQGRRDRLIARLFAASGLRAGELLKLCTTDVNDNYEISPGKVRGVIDVVRKPNDPKDERQNEPAVKTIPGPIQIPRQIASEIKRYIVNDRRIAMNRRNDGKEHPYLFVCHSGPNIGKPISRRNLNRIIAKLKKVPGLPDSISPHILRHTHFTEYADLAEANGKGPTEVRALLTKRGHWAPESKMPEHYTKRRIERQEAELTAERDELIAPR